ncbi:unnamed protein product [Adineta steineri]|uniref:Uncharacterized protein n=1 Tax=Adineta steineri TaxID=433720 RepID=A0A814JA53_9BILA|nr:unnamed protein product [Adineta steineri]
MSTTSTDIPTLRINENGLQNFVRFIYKHEKLLKQFGAIKVQPNIDCKLDLKKRQKNFLLHPTMKKIVKINENVNIYSTQTINHINESTQKHLMATDEYSFGSSLSTSNKE